MLLLFFPLVWMNHEGTKAFVPREYRWTAASSEFDAAAHEQYYGINITFLTQTGTFPLPFFFCFTRMPLSSIDKIAL